MINPCGHRVLVKPIPVKTKTDSGILIAADERKEKSAANEGTIIAIGAMAWRAYDKDQSDWKPWAKVGDRVQWAKYAGVYSVDPDNPKEDYYILNDGDVLAVLTKDN